MKESHMEWIPGQSGSDHIGSRKAVDTIEWKEKLLGCRLILTWDCTNMEVHRKLSDNALYSTIF